jgi:hypothetical protein
MTFLITRSTPCSSMVRAPVTWTIFLVAGTLTVTVGMNHWHRRSGTRF